MIWCPIPTVIAKMFSRTVGCASGSWHSHLPFCHVLEQLDTKCYYSKAIYIVIALIYIFHRHLISRTKRIRTIGHLIGSDQIGSRHPRTREMCNECVQNGYWICSSKMMWFKCSIKCILNVPDPHCSFFLASTNEFHREVLCVLLWQFQ